jgi:lipopolysaccharide biosynthesis regulator YciM
MSDKQYTHVIDSLTKKYNKLEKETNFEISQLKFELKLQSGKAEEADKRAEAVQSVAEKVRTNTTVNVRGAERDTSKIK